MRSRLPRLAGIVLSLLLLGPGLACAGERSGDGGVPCLPAGADVQCPWRGDAEPCRDHAGPADAATGADAPGCCALSADGRGRGYHAAAGGHRDLEPEAPAASMLPAPEPAIPWPRRAAAGRSPAPSGVFLAGTRTYLLTARIRA